MRYKKLGYFFLDVVIIAGIPITIIIKKDNSLIPLFIGALLVNLMHQIWGEAKYFKGMFDQGRPYYIKYYYPLL